MKQALFIHHASARRFKLLPAQAGIASRGGWDSYYNNRSRDTGWRDWRNETGIASLERRV